MTWLRTATFSSGPLILRTNRYLAVLLHRSNNVLLVLSYAAVFYTESHNMIQWDRFSPEIQRAYRTDCINRRNFHIYLYRVMQIMHGALLIFSTGEAIPVTVHILAVKEREIYHILISRNRGKINCADPEVHEPWIPCLMGMTM